MLGGISLAVAADPTPQTSPAAPSSPIVNWTGFYFGAGIAQDFASSFLSRPSFTSYSGTSIGSIDPKRAFAAYVGFNYQATPWAVFGVEAGNTSPPSRVAPGFCCGLTPWSMGRSGRPGSM
jgi:hypothetical protein